jgi:hypothetical protein
MCHGHRRGSGLGLQTQGLPCSRARQLRPPLMLPPSLSAAPIEHTGEVDLRALARLFMHARCLSSRAAESSCPDFWPRPRAPRGGGGRRGGGGGTVAMEGSAWGVSAGFGRLWEWSGESRR